MSTSTFTTIYDALSTITNVQSIILFLIGVVAATIVLVLFIVFFLRKEVRLFRNRRRPIMIFYPKGSDFNLGSETKMLRESKLFNIPENPTDNHQDCHSISNHGLVVVGYVQGMLGFKEILDAVKAKKIPIIVYTKQRLADADNKLLETYPWFSVCNFPLKLMNDIFTILSTFPNDKR